MQQSVQSSNMSHFQFNLNQLAMMQQTPVGPYNPFPTAPTNDRTCMSRESASSGYQSEISSPIMANWNGMWSNNGASINWDGGMLDKTLTQESSVETVIHTDVGKDLDEGMNGWVDGPKRYLYEEPINSGYPVQASSSSNVCCPGVFTQREYKEIQKMLAPEPKVPPLGYICHICYQCGHYITDCPKAKADIQSQYTPYQGPKICYGEFVCQNCKRCWQTGKSYSNQTQLCIKCKIDVFPRKQFSIERAVDMGLLIAKDDGGFIAVKNRKNYLNWTSLSTNNNNMDMSVGAQGR